MLQRVLLELTVKDSLFAAGHVTKKNVFSMLSLPTWTLAINNGSVV